MSEDSLAPQRYRVRIFVAFWNFILLTRGTIHRVQRRRDRAKAG